MRDTKLFNRLLVIQLVILSEAKNLRSFVFGDTKESKDVSRSLS
jgi:hypothetical protein